MFNRTITNKGILFKKILRLRKEVTLNLKKATSFVNGAKLKIEFKL